METFITERVQKVLLLLSKNKRRLEKESAKLKSLEKKVVKSNERINKLRIQREKFRDSYDFYYRKIYDDEEYESKIRTINQHNIETQLNQKTEEQKRATRVSVPESSDEE